MIPAWIAIVVTVSYLIVLATNIYTMNKQLKLLRLQREYIAKLQNVIDLQVNFINDLAIKAGLNPVQLFKEFTGQDKIH